MQDIKEQDQNFIVEEDVMFLTNVDGKDEYSITTLDLIQLLTDGSHDGFVVEDDVMFFKADYLNGVSTFDLVLRAGGDGYLNGVSTFDLVL